MRKYARFVQKSGQLLSNCQKLKLNSEEKDISTIPDSIMVSGLNLKMSIRCIGKIVLSLIRKQQQPIHHIMDLMSEIETILGNEKEAKDYRSFADKCRKSYQALREKCPNIVWTDRQARLVRPLYFDLLNEKQREYAKD